MNILVYSVLAISAFGFSFSADALCIYKGAVDSKITMSEEASDSKWVVRAKVLSSTDGSSGDFSWTAYDLKIDQAYKGAPPSRLKFFTLRDSGGFYMDRPQSKRPAAPDIGGSYLLFLTPTSSDGMPPAAANAVFVTYNCGWSRPWSEVSTSLRQSLVKLSRH